MQPTFSRTDSFAPAAPVTPVSSFDDLALIEPLRRAVAEEGYRTPTPIQQQAIPQVLAGRDVLGIAQTGTGKTAAFALPILQRLAAQPPRRGPEPRVLVLSPTRELAMQIADSFAAYGRHTPLTHTVIFGGVGQDAQVRALRQGVDVLVATPGRLLDLMQQGLVRLDRLTILVLDEADRMLDMGFLPDVRRIVAAVPRERQTLFFSATMPDDIQSLARAMLVAPVRVEVTPVASTVERIAQSVYLVDRQDKRALLQAVLQDSAIARVLVFTRTKHGANRVAEQLVRASIPAEAIHGNKSQNARQRALASFKAGTTRVLVATDIAARGIDIDGITHVINYELPNVPETYVHRIGRTARAGADGVAISFCEAEERPFLADIERLIRRQVPRAATPALPPVPAPHTGPALSQSGHHGGHHGGHQGGHHGGSPRQAHGRPAPASPRHTPQPGAARPAAPRPPAPRSSRPLGSEPQRVPSPASPRPEGHRPEGHRPEGHGGGRRRHFGRLKRSPRAVETQGDEAPALMPGLLSPRSIHYERGSGLAGPG